MKKEEIIRRIALFLTILYFIDREVKIGYILVFLFVIGIALFG